MVRERRGTRCGGTRGTGDAEALTQMKEGGHLSRRKEIWGKQMVCGRDYKHQTAVWQVRHDGR